MDVQTYIIESLDFNELLSLSETNKMFSSLATSVFKRMHGHKTLVIEIYASRNNFYGNSRDSDEIIHVRPEHSVPRILKQFGRFISKLRLISRFDQSSTEDKQKAASIMESIGLYCSESLNELYIDNHYSHLLNNLKRPFTNVNHVELKGRYARLGSSTLNITELFPKMSRLTLQYVKIEDESNIDWNLPLLEDFQVTTRYSQETFGFTESELEKVLRENPQLRILRLSGVSQRFLVEINGILPNLENLQISSANRLHVRDFATERVVFRNVTVFSTYWEMERFPDNIEFPNLVELNVAISIEKHFEWWIDYLKEHTNLKRFHVKLGSIDDDELKKLTTLNLALDEASFVIDRHVSDESVVAFVRKNHNIKKITFEKFKYIESSFESKIEALRQEFSHKWKITNTTDEIVLCRYQQIPSEN